MPPEAGAAIGAGAGTLGCGACAGTFLVAGAAEAAGRAGAREGDEVRELAGRWKQTKDRKDTLRNMAVKIKVESSMSMG